MIKFMVYKKNHCLQFFQLPSISRFAHQSFNNEIEKTELDWYTLLIGYFLDLLMIL